VTPLVLSVRTVPAPPLVAVAGEIDMATADELRDCVLAMPDGDVILNLSGVQLLAAAGLTVLLELHDGRARVGARLVVAAAPRSVRRVLAVTGHETTFLTTDTVDDAIALIRGAAGQAWPMVSSDSDGHRCGLSRLGHGFTSRPPSRQFEQQRDRSTR
jgi:anti-sigma B factor antagonist